jgi:hypothetical protein
MSPGTRIHAGARNFFTVTGTLMYSDRLMPAYPGAMTSACTRFETISAP